MADRRALSEQSRTNVHDRMDPELLHFVPEDPVSKHELGPVEIHGDSLVVARLDGGESSPSVS